MSGSAHTAAHPVALQQHHFFAAALRACGQPPLIVPGADPLILMHRRLKCGVWLAMLSRAAMADAAGCLSRLVEAGIDWRTPVILSPDAPTPDLARLGAVPLMTPATLVKLDLTRTEEQRRRALHQKWRNRLVRAEKGPLRVTRQNMPCDPGHWLIRTDSAQQHRRRYRNWPNELTLAYAAENRSQAKLFTAFEGKQAVAAMLFLRHGDGATYHMGHSTPRGRQLSAHNLLLWRASCWLAAKGHTNLDLGLINTTHSPELARFKLGVGAQPHRLGGTWGWWPPLGRTFSPLALLDRHVM